MSLRSVPSRRGDDGFTLIELLVVMIIIGVLAGIAIPVFINQRKRAVDAAIRTDLRTVALSEEQYLANQQTYLAISPATNSPTIDDPLHLSKGVVVTVVLNTTRDSFCIQGHAELASHDWVYINNNGGQQPSTVTTCPASF